MTIVYAPFFFAFRISIAFSEYPGAITPSETSLEMIFAVSTSHSSERAIKSPKELILSAPLALTYAVARGESFVFGEMKYISLSSSVKGMAMAAPAGETCLKEAAEGIFVVSFSSFTNCQAFKASRKLIYPALPFRTVTGSFPSIEIDAGFWLGLRPYFSSILSVLPPSLALMTSSFPPQDT